MVKNNFVQRLILALIALPALIFMLLYATWYHNAAMSAVILCMGALGSIEVGQMLLSRRSPVLCLLSSLVTLSAYIQGAVGMEFPLVACVLLVCVLAIITSVIFNAKGESLENCADAMVKRVFTLLYPSALLSFAVLVLCEFKKGNILLLFMLLMVFVNDTFCYIGGKLLGRNNKGFIKASPNKSIAGFISGYVFTFAAGIALTYVLKGLPDIFFEKKWVLALVSMGISTIANIGDLAESLLKRSAHIKDSGTIMLGRGGAMDSIDSICLISPFFYLTLKLIIKSV